MTEAEITEASELNECPHWCAIDHEENDPPHETAHRSVSAHLMERDEVTVRHEDLDLLMVKHPDAVDSYVQVSDGDAGGQVLRLTPGSARRVASEVLRLLDDLELP